MWNDAPAYRYLVPTFGASAASHKWNNNKNTYTFEYLSIKLEYVNSNNYIYYINANLFYDFRMLRSEYDYEAGSPVWMYRYLTAMNLLLFLNFINNLISYHSRFQVFNQTLFNEKRDI